MDIPSAGSSADLYKSAITKSIQSIVLDDTLSPEEKEEMIEKSLAQYHDKMMELTQAAEEPPAQENPISKSDPDRFVEIVEVEKFNPYHDAKGRFSTANGATSFTYAPGKSKAHDNAIAREKERTAAEEAAAKPKFTFNPAKTKKEAVAYAQSELGFTKVSYGSKLDIDTINHINEQIAHIQQKYPETKGAVQEIKTTGSRCYAAIQPDRDGSMTFLIGRDIYGAGKDFVAKNYERDVEVGFHPKGTDSSSIIWHEYGHVLATISAKAELGASPKGRLSSYQDQAQFCKERRAYSNEFTWCYVASQNSGKDMKTLKKEISRYAEKNHAETFAEAFAEVTCSATPGDAAVAVVKASGWYR